MKREPRVGGESAPLRPSRLARFWALDPRTLTAWIRAGRLPAVRAPGGHFRVRPDDLRAFCERERLPFPAFASTRVHLVGGSAAIARQLARAIDGSGELEWLDDAYRGLVRTVASPPAVLVIDARARGFSALRAVEALGEASLDPPPRIVVFGVDGAARCRAFLGAGAAAAIGSGKRADLPRIVAELAAAAST